MANHNNYAIDRDLMMEAYASVKGEVPATSTTAMPRMFNEAHCDEEHAEGGHSPVDAAVAAIDAIANGDTNAISSFTEAIDQLAATLQGNEKVAVYEDLRDYIKGSLHGSDVAEDLQDYLKRGLSHSEDGEHAEDAEGQKKEFTFGYDLENVAEVMKYVKDNYAEGDDYKMTIGYGDDVMNHLEVKDGSKLLKDEHFLGLVDDCAGGGDFDEGDDFAEDAEGVNNGNVEVTKPCTAEIWSGRTQLKSKEYNPGDKIPALSSRVEGDDVAVVTDDGVTMYLPVDCVSVEGEHAEDAEEIARVTKQLGIDVK